MYCNGYQLPVPHICPDGGFVQQRLHRRLAGARGRGLSWDAQTDSLVTLEDNGTNGELPQDLLFDHQQDQGAADIRPDRRHKQPHWSERSHQKKTGYAYLTDR